MNVFSLLGLLTKKDGKRIMAGLVEVQTGLDALNAKLVETDAVVEAMFVQIKDLTDQVAALTGSGITPEAAQALLDKIAVLSATAAKIQTQDDFVVPPVEAA